MCVVNVPLPLPLAVSRAENSPNAAMPKRIKLMAFFIVWRKLCVPRMVRKNRSPKQSIRSRRL
jgi:hypothetical protein